MTNFPWWSVIAVAISSLSFVLFKTMVFESYRIKTENSKARLRKFRFYERLMLLSIFSMTVTIIVAMYSIWNYLSTAHG